MAGICYKEMLVITQLIYLNEGQEEAFNEFETRSLATITVNYCYE